jgi:glycosyltransferase involved in cell wall biosynthesis
MSLKSPHVSIVIPVYNAEKLIIPSLKKIVAAFDHQKILYEIILRDDGSRDRSIQILRCLPPAEFSCVRVYVNERNIGLGDTLRQLISTAQSENVIYCDIDLPFGVDIFFPLLEGLQTHDIVVASRYNGQKNRLRPTRWLLSRLYYGLCKGLFDIPVRDIGSGTVAMRKKSFKALGCQAQGFDIHMEMYVQAKKKSLSIQEIPAPFEETGHGSFRPFKHGPRILWQTLNYRFRHSLKS